MTMEPLSLPTGPNLPPAHSGLHAQKVAGIRRQASVIIEAVLDSSESVEAGFRDRLREHVAAHPGRPEVALAEHLLAIRSLSGLPGGASMAFAPAVTPGVETSAGSLAAAERASRILSVLNGRMLLTAFQPIYELTTRSVVGVEALTRFVTDGADNADYWFAEAAEARLGSELEFAALESALITAGHIPSHLYVGLKLSPAACLDPLLPGLLEESLLAPDRIVLELTEALTAEQAAALESALSPLRGRGVRLAVDHIGSYFDSIRHIRKLKPDIIKLDRDLIAGIDTDTLRHAFGEAMIGFAEQLGATLIAAGIETREELATIAGLGATAAQGYLLGRPTTSPQDWARWNRPDDQVGSDKPPPRASIWF